MLPFLKFTSLAPLVAIFIIFRLYFMLLSQEEIDVLPMIELRSFAVFANFRLKPLQFNLRILTQWHTLLKPNFMVMATCRREFLKGLQYC